MAIVLDPYFVAIRMFPGYFYHTGKRELFSIKSGSMKKCSPVNKKFVKNNKVRYSSGKVWRISHDGEPRYIFQEEAIQEAKEQEIVVIGPNGYSFMKDPRI